MKLNHLDLQVHDVPATVQFFQRFFDMRLQTSASSPKIAILTDGQGFVLVLQRCEDAADRYPEGFHLGFLLDDVESVKRLQARARQEGATVSDLVVNGRGTMIYFTLAENYRVEVSCQNRRFL